MNDLFASNLRLLEPVSPGITDRLSSAVSVLDEYQVVAAKNGQVTLRRKKGRDWVYLHSRFDPQKEAVGIVTRLKQTDPLVVIIMGLGLGYLLSACLERYPECVKIVVVENNPALFRLFLKHHSVAQALSRGVSFAVGKTAPEVMGTLRPLMWELSTGRFQIVSSPAMLQNVVVSDRACYQDLTGIIKKELNTFMIDLGTQFYGDYPVHKNTVANMKHIRSAPGVVRLFDKFRDIPAVIVGAGPSLSTTLPALRSCRETVVIIATDTSLSALQAAGIVPDLAVTVDFSELNYRKFSDLTFTGYRLVAVPSVVPQVMDRYAGSQFVAYIPTPFFTMISTLSGEKGFLDSGGSVAHLAFDLAVRMGCSDIILLGMDLACTGGKSHAEGTMFEKQSFGENELRNMIPIPGSHQDVVYTTSDMWHMLGSFEKMIKHRNIPVIDATGGGALIAGTTVMSLEEAVRGRASVKQRIQAAITDACQSAGPSVVRQGLFAGVIGELEDVRSLSRKAADVCNAIARDEYASGAGTGLPDHTKMLHEYIGKMQDKPHAAILLESYLLRFSYIMDRRRNLEVDFKNQVLNMHDMFTAFQAACVKYIALFESV